MTVDERVARAFIAGKTVVYNHTQVHPDRVVVYHQTAVERHGEHISVTTWRRFSERRVFENRVNAILIALGSGCRVSRGNMWMNGNVLMDMNHSHHYIVPDIKLSPDTGRLHKTATTAPGPVSESSPAA